MGRIPESARRRCIQTGDAVTVIPVMIATPSRGHSCGSTTAALVIDDVVVEAMSMSAIGVGR